jgi:two-component system KDP operon response regulator KdpE
VVRLAGRLSGLRVVINQLRKKIEKKPAHPEHILTEPWVGYRFQAARGKTSK